MGRRPCFGGLVGATVFFALTFTPSLIPRSWMVQGVLAGLDGAIGYGFGSAGSALVRKVLPREPGPTVKRRAWIGLSIGAPLLVVAAAALGARWDEELRALMEMDNEQLWDDLAMVAVAIVAATVLVLVWRAVRGLWRVLVSVVNRLLPRPAAIALGGALTVLIVVAIVFGWIAEGMFQSVELSSRAADAVFDVDVEQPQSPNRSGSSESSVAWGDLGNKGREFVAGGPTVAEIGAFTGGDAEEPIRVYAGLRAGDSLDERVDLILAELDRTDAWSRSAIIVQTPSGNGEIPRVNASAPEYVLAGDVAQVALQYSYAPSFSTIVLKPGAGEAAGQAMIDAVTARLDALPDTERPALYVAGESLGSSSTEAAFDGFDDMVADVDGALLVGPTFFNEIRNDLTAARDAGSPVWRPVVDRGETVRFALTPDDLDLPGRWDGTRIVYLQNSSDPVAWFDFDLLWSPPEFLDDPRGPDVSPAMNWFPVVTFWQTLVDLPFASGATEGHGHRYGLNVADGWVAVLQPDDWTPDDTARLRDTLDED